MSSTDYNGYPNRETWAVNLHWANNQGDYGYWRHAAEDTLNGHVDKADALTDLAEQMEAALDEMYADIERAALNREAVTNRDAWLMLMDIGFDTAIIEWRRVADGWLDDAYSEAVEANSLPEEFELPKVAPWQVQRGQYIRTRWEDDESVCGIFEVKSATVDRFDNSVTFTVADGTEWKYTSGETVELAK